MTNKQAFRAMVYFLERHFERTKSDDIGALLGDLLVLEDGMTADPAAWPEWLECVRIAEQEVVSEKGSESH